MTDATDRPTCELPADACGGSPTSERRASLRILFLARELRIGGAERQLCLLARGLAARGHRVGIALFYQGGALEADLAGSEVELIALGKGGRYELIAMLRRLDAVVRDFRPDVLHGYLPIPNLIALSQRWRGRRPRIVWGVRASALDLSRYDRVTRWSYRLEARLAGLADLIIANSKAGASAAIEAGFPQERMVCIPNAVDRARFRVDPERRARARQGWGVRPGEFVVGAIGRIDPMKDFDTFLRAVAAAAKACDNIRAVALAAGSEGERAGLRRRAADLGIAERFTLAERTAEVVEVLNGFDLYCSTSAYGEGFPNTVAEAMACSVPCVVTAVGDSAELVGNAGAVVAPRDPRAMATAILALADLAALARQEIGERLSARVAEFTPEKLVRRTEGALRQLLVGVSVP
jgi:glycosyltransferase involved in cell wall biosynthesis